MLEVILEIILGGNEAERYRNKHVALSGGLLVVIVLMVPIIASALDSLGPLVNSWRPYVATAFVVATVGSLCWFLYSSWCWYRYRGAEMFVR